MLLRRLFVSATLLANFQIALMNTAQATPRRSLLNSQTTSEVLASEGEILDIERASASSTNQVSCEVQCAQRFTGTGWQDVLARIDCRAMCRIERAVVDAAAEYVAKLWSGES